MKTSNIIAANIKYAEILDIIIDRRERYGIDMVKSQYIFRNQHKFEQIHDHVNINDEYKIWMIYNPYKETYNELAKCNINFFTYKKLIYGFFEKRRYNIIVISKDE